MGTTRILGTRYTISGLNHLPQNKAVILVANHQSMYDILPIIWRLRRLHPKFVSKASLGKRYSFCFLQFKTRRFCANQSGRR